MERTGRISTPRAERARRSLYARGFLTVAFLVLIGAAGRLQILEVDKWATIAKTNRLREVSIPAPRGTIYDRHGNVVAENIVGYRVQLMPGRRDSMDAQLKRLQPILGLTDEQIAAARKKWLRESHLPMTVMMDTPPVAVARLQEQRSAFPTVLVDEYAKRHYPAGEAIAHMIGYISEISEQELKSREFVGYTQGQWIGKGGLERAYENMIGGIPGSRYLEIDAQGRIKRLLPEELGMPAIPGRDLQLYFDLDLQRYIEGIWPRAYRGGMVAIDPATGGVLAYYSYPSFDPNRFIGGIPMPYWDSLRADSGKPLLDRAGGSGSAQPPASAWKLIVAAMALEEKAITVDQYMPVACGGGMHILGRYARCWDAKGHGRVDLIRGIMYSCDVYFYQVGARLGLKRYTETGTRMGFQKRTGIDLPGEARNLFPDSPDWWQRTFRYKPKENEVVSLAIGQGPIAMSPLKMAAFYTGIARPDGKVPALRIARLPQDTARPVVIDMALNRKYVDAMWRGMRRVVGPGGTAQLTRLKEWDLMGKTGTAQVCADCSIRDHAWFIGMGALPGHDPEIVVAMFMEHGEHGYTPSDYVANAINFFLSRKYNRPFERWPTPRQRIQRELPVDFQWLYSAVIDPPRSDSTRESGPAAAR